MEIKTNKILIRDPDTKKYEPFLAIQGESAYEIAKRHGYEGTEEEWNNALEAERIAAITSIEEKGQQTRESIPNDYTALSEQVEKHDDLLHPFMPGKSFNKLDETLLTNAWINESTGVITENDDFRLSPYITLSEFTSGYVSAYSNRFDTSEKRYIPYGSYYRCCFFADKNGTVVSGGSRPNPSDVDNCSVEIPTDAKYMRVSFNTARDLPMYYMVVDAQVTSKDDAPSYVSYKKAGAEKTIASNNGLNLSWEGKTWLSYGDSITAIGNGNITDNEDTVEVGAWQRYVHEYFRFDKYYGRGIGGQTFMKKTIPWFANADGSYNSRPTSGSMEDLSSYTVPDGLTAHWGYFCSWDRITTMIPDSIKDTIDLIFLFGVNDHGQISTFDFTPPTFIEGATEDAEWASETENTTKFNGDFDVTEFTGAVASTILKLQTRCPNALIVFGTSWSGRGHSSSDNPNADSTYYDETSGQKIWEEGNLVKQIADYFSIPCVDVWANTGVNPFNRSQFNADVIHPYLEKGKKALARAVICGLKQIEPRFDT